MFTVSAPSRITTVSELKRDTKKTLEASKEGPIYVLKDGKPVAAVVSIEMVELLNEVREDRRLVKVAAERLEAILSGHDKVLNDVDFWTEVEKRRPAARKKKPL